MTMNQEPKENIFSSVNLMAFLFKWKGPILIVTLLAAGVSVIVSLMLQDKYETSVILFPTDTSSISEPLLGKGPDAMRFGEEEDTERLLEVLNSNAVRDRIIEKHDLFDHYGISREKPNPRARIERAYKNNVSFKRTKYGAVKIEVIDKDPEKAASIANDIAALLDSTQNRMQNERARKGLNIVRGEYRALRDRIRTLEDSLNEIRQKGVHDYESQSEVWNEQLAIAIRENNTRARRTLEAEFDTLAMYGSEYLSLQEELETAHERLGLLYNKYQEAKVNTTRSMPHKFVLDRATPPDKAAYPIRWLIVAGSTIAAFLLSIFLILLMEQVKVLRQKSGEKQA